MSTDAQFDRHEDHIKVPPTRKLAYGMGDVGQRLMNDTFNGNYLMLYNVFLGYSPSMMGLALMIPRFIDAITDPFMGQLSDNTRTRWGRRRPYILFGGIAAGLSSALVWLIPGGLSPTVFFAILMTVYLIYSLSAKAALVPYGALGMEISIDYHERTSVQAYRTFVAVGIGGTLTAATLFIATHLPFPSDAFGLRAVAVGFGLSAILCFWLTFKGTREEAEIQAQPKVPWLQAFKATLTNWPFLVILSSLIVIIFGVFTIIPLGGYVGLYYVFQGDIPASSVVGMYGGWLTNVITVALLPLFLKLAVRFGKKNIYVLCTFALGLTFIVTLFIYDPEHPYLMLVFSGLLALPLNGINLMPGAMIADVCDLDELKTGCRREGAFNGVFSLLLKIVMVPVPLLTGLILDWTGFNPTLTMQTTETVFRLRMIFAFIPLVFVCVGALLAIVYPLTETRVREVRAQLEARRKQHGLTPVVDVGEGSVATGGDLAPEPLQ